MIPKKIPLPYKHLGASLIVIAAVMALGTLGYTLIERWSFIDSLYMTVITAATVGFKEVMPLSRAGTVFTIVLIIVGVGAFAFTFGSITELFVRGTFQNYLGRARMEKEIKKLSGHFIVCGYGRMGKTIGQQFGRNGLSYVVIDSSEAVVKAAWDEGVLAILGDSGSEATLMEARLDQAKALVCTCSPDAQNLMTAITARSINQKLFIAARVEEPNTEKKLKMVGADKIISPYYLGALSIAQAVMCPAALNFIEISTLNHEFGLTLDELPVSANSKLADCSIMESNLKSRYNVMILGITDEKGRLNFNPPADTRIKAGDRLILMGNQKRLVELAEWSGL